MKTKPAVYGIDRVLAVLSGNPAADVGVKLSTLKRWRAADPLGALAKLIERNTSQTQLAARLGVAQKTVNNWARTDRPPADKLPSNAVEWAVSKAGGQPKMAEELGVTQQCVSRWCRQGYVPTNRAKEIELCYGVPRADLISPKLRSDLGAGGDL